MERIKAMNTMKILTICVSMVLIISVILWLWLRVPFITQSMENIDRIVVLIDPYHGGTLRTIYITEQSKIEYVYELLKETKVARVNRWPDHLSSLQFDSKFEVRIEYQNGKVDEIRAVASDAIFRMLDTKGNSNDRGHIRGSNEKLWEYVHNLN